MHCTKSLAEFRFGGQMSKIKVTKDKKRQSEAFFGSGPREARCRLPVLRRWKDQCMLSSLHLYFNTITRSIFVFHI